MLRRPHDHHRDLRAQLPAALPTIDGNRPPGSIRHDRDHRIATTPRRSRLLLVLNRLPSRSLNCAVRPSTQACNRHTQRPSQPSIPAAVACLSRYCSRRGASRSFAHTFGVSQIPIAKAAAPPPTTARGFVPWRLSDAGQRVRGSVDHRRHPKPCTQADQATCAIRGARHADVFQLGQPRKILPIRTSVRIP